MSFEINVIFNEFTRWVMILIFLMVKMLKARDQLEGWDAKFNGAYFLT